MRISSKGLRIIKSNEGLKLRAYLCPAKVWTIGYGSTGPHVKPNSVITEAEAEALLKKDLVRFEDGVTKAVAPKVPAQEEFDAMVSLAFNIGIAAFARSSVCKLFKQGDKAKAANAFGMWVKGGGRTLPGLVRRRAEEKALFLSAEGNVQPVLRRTSVAKMVELPEESTVPDAPKPLAKSREIIFGGSLGIGGVANFVNGLTANDLAEAKGSIASVGADANAGIMKEIHVPEIASGLVVAIGLFMIYKRFKDRKDGIR
jgi:lysozyme